MKFAGTFERHAQSRTIDDAQKLENLADIWDSFKLSITIDFEFL
jgi:hypothetical protein